MEVRGWRCCFSCTLGFWCCSLIRVFCRVRQLTVFAVPVIKLSFPLFLLFLEIVGCTMVVVEIKLEIPG